MTNETLEGLYIGMREDMAFEMLISREAFTAIRAENHGDGEGPKPEIRETLYLAMTQHQR
jgi:hypothetical protein